MTDNRDSDIGSHSESKGDADRRKVGFVDLPNSTKNRWRHCAMLVLFILPLVTILLVSAPAEAANPAGSYQQTCNNIHVSGSTLYANCKNRSGGWQSTQLPDFAQCVSDIENINGSLLCNKGVPPPPGSYKQTCQGVYMSGTTLNANCRNSGGQWIS